MKLELFFKFLLEQSPFCGASDHPYFGLRVTAMGFKTREVLLPALLMSGVTPAFSTNRVFTVLACIQRVYLPNIPHANGRLRYEPGPLTCKGKGSILFLCLCKLK